MLKVEIIFGGDKKLVKYFVIIECMHILID